MKKKPFELRPENKKMIEFLATLGIDAKVKFIHKGRKKNKWVINMNFTSNPALSATLIGAGFEPEYDYQDEIYIEHDHLKKSHGMTMTVRGHSNFLDGVTPPSNATFFYRK